MTGTAHAGLAILALVFAGAVLLLRYALTGGEPRERRPRRIEVEVPGHHLIPALAYGTPAERTFAHCLGCHHQVPVTIHGAAHRCDANHVTIHTTTGEPR